MFVSSRVCLRRPGALATTIRNFDRGSQSSEAVGGVSTKPAAIATRRARAKAIKLGDKICNVVDVTSCPPADSDVARRREYLAWSVAVVEGCRGSGGAVVGRPRWVRMASTGSAVVMTARMRMSAPQAGQVSGKTS
jgi:hypothetical protein